MIRLTHRLLLAVAVLTSWIGPARSAPDAELWARWTTFDPASTATVDHGAWAAFVDRYRVAGADGIARIRYAAVSGQDRAAIDAYLDRLAATRVSALGRSEQRAFWINLYNALTVRVVLDHIPVETIRDIDISPGMFADGPWQAPLIAVEGTPVSLDDIEHRILRPIWHDARLHYVVNCAALGCPDLPPEAFTAANAERLLDAAARAYINHPRGATVDADGDLIVSSLYDWYAADFGVSDAAIIDHLRAYADPALTGRLAGITEIDDDAYDWRLNDAP